MVSTSSITKQSLGKIALRAPVVGAKRWCLFFFVTLRVRSTVRAFEGCIVRTSIALPFIGRFWRGFQRFFRRHCSFRCTTHFRRLRGATIFAKLRLKIAKSPKIGRQVCAHHLLRIDSWEIWRKFHRRTCSLGPRM